MVVTVLKSVITTMIELAGYLASLHKSMLELATCSQSEHTVHRRRLHWADRSHGQKVVGRCPQVEFCYVIFSNNKIGHVLGIWFNPSRGCTGNYERVTCKWQKEPSFQPNNAPKAFGGRALPGLAKVAYSAPPDIVAGFKG